MKYIYSLITGALLIGCSSEKSIGEKYCECYDEPKDKIESCKEKYFTEINKMEIDNPAEFVQVRNQIRDCEANQAEELNK